MHHQGLEGVMAGGILEFQTIKIFHSSFSIVLTWGRSFILQKLGADAFMFVKLELESISLKTLTT